MSDTKIPRHVAIIMDGNGRWANARGKERTYGHIQGVESVRTILKSARAHGIEYLTLYVFSTENWGRPKEEVDMLMELFCENVIREIPELKAEGILVKMIGEREGMPENVIRQVDVLENETASGEKLTVLFAMNYSSRNELANSFRKMALEVQRGKLEIVDINPETISDALYTAPYPDPDLIIRTGGDQRMSNFLLWQAAYSELYFSEVYWPEFGKDEFDEALDEYTRRERRFGLVNEKDTNNRLNNND